MAYTYRLLGRMDKAIEALQTAEKNGIVFRPEEETVIAQILAPEPAAAAGTPQKIK